MTIDQLATLIRELLRGGGDVSANDLPPGIYDVQESEIVFGVGITVILPQNIDRHGVFFGSPSGGTFKYGFSNNFTISTGFSAASTGGISYLIGREWYEFVRRDIFGLGTAPGTITVAQLIRVGYMGGE